MEDMLNANVVYSSKLFATPSALSGLARVLDVAGLFDSYNVSGSDAEADASAIANDWRIVGDTMRQVLESYGR